MVLHGDRGLTVGGNAQYTTTCVISHAQKMTGISACINCRCHAAIPYDCHVFACFQELKHYKRINVDCGLAVWGNHGQLPSISWSAV